MNADDIQQLVGQVIAPQQVEHLHPGRCPVCHSGDTWLLLTEIPMTMGQVEPRYVFEGLAECNRRHVWNPLGAQEETE